MFTSEVLNVCRSAATGQFVKSCCCNAAKSGNPALIAGAVVLGAVAVGLSYQSVKKAEKEENDND